jgi:CRP-like cAMP-binding protein
MTTSSGLADRVSPVDRGTRDSRIAFLRDLPVFARLSDEWLVKVASYLDTERFSEEERIYRAGDPSDSLYLIERGRVSLFSNTVGRPTRLFGYVGPGEIFGELELIEGTDRTAVARALEPTTALTLGKADFAELIASNSGLSLRFTLLALSRFSVNIARLLEPSCRNEARIYLGRIVRLELGAGPPRHVSLENLSTGGMCLRGLSGVPLPEEAVSGVLGLTDGRELLRFSGRIAWQRNRAIGVSFSDDSPEHSARIRQALRLVLAVE